jgi:hypothetical protein
MLFGDARQSLESILAKQNLAHEWYPSRPEQPHTAADRRAGRGSLAPLLFQDHDRAAAAAERTSVVAPAELSPAARQKKARRRTAEGLPVHSFRTLLADLATATRACVRVGEHAFDQLAPLTALQERAFQLLEVRWR